MSGRRKKDKISGSWTSKGLMRNATELNDWASLERSELDLAWTES